MSIFEADCRSALQMMAGFHLTRPIPRWFPSAQKAWVSTAVAGAESTFERWNDSTPDDLGEVAARLEAADWGYLRLHEGQANPAPCYGRTALANWAARLAEMWDETEDVFAYFNNDHGGCAVRDAHRFALASTRADLSPTRVPTSREASLTVEQHSG